MISVTSRARRVLRDLDRFTTDSHKLGDLATTLQLHQAEQAVGVYHNSGFEDTPDIMFSSHGIYLLDAPCETIIPYREIKAVTMPEDRAKHLADRVRLILKDDTRVDIPILGGGEKFRDAFSLVRFLDRVVGDLENGTLKSETDTETQ